MTGVQTCALPISEVNKFIQKKTYSKDELFGKGNNMEDEYDEEQYFINPKLVNRDYASLSEELFIWGFKQITDWNLHII